MTPISPRYLPALLGLLLLALAPLAYQAIAAPPMDDCRDAQALLAAGSIPGSEPDPSPPELHHYLFARASGTFLSPGRGPDPLDFMILRSHRTEIAFDRPTRFLEKRFIPDRRELRQIETGEGPLPVHLFYRYHLAWVQVAAVVFAYDGRPVESLLPMQIATAPRQIRDGRLPITAMVASAVTPHRRGEEIEASAIAWATAAWEHHRKACLP